jgi:hypothetical protein
MHAIVKSILQTQASEEDELFSQPVKNLVHYLFSLNKNVATEGLSENMTTFDRLSVPVTAAFQKRHSCISKASQLHFKSVTAAFQKRHSAAFQKRHLHDYMA